MHILMVAAENGALPGGKVGGIGDVIRDAPIALAKAGHRVTVVTPGYGSLSALPEVSMRNTMTVEFCRHLEELALLEIKPASEQLGVTHLLLENALFAACGIGSIYCDDEWGPFSTDAHKFALFCLGVCHAIVTGAIERPDVIHLHDWHAALLLFLRRHHPAYKALRSLRVVYTIHNLSLQGVRPFQNNGSSLEDWFALSDYDPALIADPRTPSCVNMMRMGINLADKVHVVSPTYAREILQPSNPRQGFVGGEGLEADLQRISRGKKLVGILNGCDYEGYRSGKPTAKSFLSLANDCLGQWAGNRHSVAAAHFFAQRRIMAWSSGKWQAKTVVASINRLTGQKVSLFETQVSPGVTALDAVLESLGESVYIMTGSGDPHYEDFMTTAMARHENFLFMRGYSEPLADNLYRFCDLFLMPSSFEPCGISQMLAMRAGKPCLVHKVGGLNDTVSHNHNGFSFSGANPVDQAQAMVKCLDKALDTRLHRQEQWRRIAQAARQTRFPWEDSVRRYVDELYCVD